MRLQWYGVSLSQNSLFLVPNVPISESRYCWHIASHIHNSWVSMDIHCVLGGEEWILL